MQVRSTAPATKWESYRDLGTVVTVSIPIPSMIVFDAAMFAFPVPGVELLPIVPRPYPASAFIRGTRPVTRVPAVSTVHRVLIAVNPNVSGAGSRRTNHDDTRRRRRSNADSNADLSAQGQSAGG